MTTKSNGSCAKKKLTPLSALILFEFKNSTVKDQLGILSIIGNEFAYNLFYLYFITCITMFSRVNCLYSPLFKLESL